MGYTSGNDLYAASHRNVYDMTQASVPARFLRTEGVLHIYEGVSYSAIPESPTVTLLLTDQCPNTLCAYSLPQSIYSGFGVLSTWADNTVTPVCAGPALIHGYKVDKSSSGDVIAVSTPQDFDAAMSSCKKQGKVWLFQKSDATKAWSQQASTPVAQVLTSPSGNDNDMFGASVFIAGSSTNSKVVVLVSAPYAQYPNSPAKGVLYAYARDASGTWVLKQTFAAISVPAGMTDVVIGTSIAGATTSERLVATALMRASSTASTVYSGFVSFKQTNYVG